MIIAENPDNDSIIKAINAHLIKGRDTSLEFMVNRYYIKIFLKSTFE